MDMNLHSDSSVTDKTTNICGIMQRYGEAEIQSYVPSLPSANLTCVGFSAVRKALNIWVLLLLILKARKRPKPKPRSDPTVAWVPILPAAFFRVSRSESCRSCLKCSSASLPMSSPAFLRSTANESADILAEYQSSIRVTVKLSKE